MSLITQRPHSVKLTQRPGTPEEKIIENVPALLTSDVSLFDIEPRVREGDLIESSHFDEPMLVIKVYRHDMRVGSLPPHQQVSVSTMRAARANARHAAVTQHFHATVGAVAGRDVNVSVSGILDAIAKHIESADISEVEKKSLTTRIRELAQHPVIAGIATNAIWQVIMGGGS